MIISDIHVNRIENPTNSVIGFASISIDDSIVIRSIQIMVNKETGTRFLGFPTQKSKSPDGKYKDIVFPKNKETREMITEQVLAAFDKL